MSGLRFERPQVSVQFLFGGDTRQVPGHHFAGGLVGFFTRPQRDQQTSDDRGVKLQFDPVGMMAHQMPASQDVLEEAEEDFSVPFIVRSKITFLSS
jgi:hypothetical protein